MTAAVARFDPVFDSQATFRVVLAAMARPGRIGRLPALDRRGPLPGGGGVAAVGLTLLDHEVGFAVVAPTDAAAGERLASHLAGATGGRIVPPEAADYAVVIGAPSVGLAGSLRRGSAAFPDESATLVGLVPSLGAADDGNEEGAVVALSGPGVTLGTTLRIGGWGQDDLAAVAAANAEPPLGIDLILIDPDGRIACLPRSTRLTVR